MYKKLPVLPWTSSMHLLAFIPGTGSTLVVVRTKLRSSLSSFIQLMSPVLIGSSLSKMTCDYFIVVVETFYLA
jgi:hypothetical protein